MQLSLNKIIENKNIILVIFFVFNLIPFCLSGFFFDDIFNSTNFIKPPNIYHDIIPQIEKWIHGGRLFVTSVFVGSFFSYLIQGSLTNFIFYKIFIFTIFFFTYIFFLKSFGLKYKSYIYIIFFFLLTIQFNPRWDPVSSFHPLIFFTTISILVSISCFKRINKKNYVYNNLISILSALYAYLSYELCLLIFPVITVVFYFNKEKKYFSYLIHLIMFLCFVLVSFYFREKGQINYDGNSFGNIKLFLSSIFINIVNTLPFIGLNNKVLPIDINFYAFIFSAPIFFFFIKNIKYELKDSKNFMSSQNERINFEFLSVSFLVLIVPAILTALSKRYQLINTIGDPYITVFVSRLGLAMILYLIFYKFIKKYNSISLIFVLLLINFNINLSLIHKKNLDFKYPREITKNFIIENKKKFTNKSSIILDQRYYEEFEKNCLLGLYVGKTNFKCKILDNNFNKNHDKIYEEILVRKRSEDKKNFMIELIYKDGTFIKKKCNIYFHFYKCSNKTGQNQKKRIFGPIIKGGFYGWEYNNNEKFMWSSGEKSFLEFYNYSNDIFKTSLTLELDIGEDGILEILYNKKAIKKIIEHKNIQNLNLILYPGLNILTFNYKGKVFNLENDPRGNFAYIIKNFKLN